MGSKAALILLTVVSPLLLLTLILGGSGVVWIGVPSICGLPILLIAVATHRKEAPRAALLAIWFLLTASWLAVAWISASTDLAHPEIWEAGMVAGLMLLGLGLGPLLLIGWLFARFFRADGLAPEDLERLRKGQIR